MAIAGSGGWIPSARVIWNPSATGIEVIGTTCNRPKEIVHTNPFMAVKALYEGEAFVFVDVRVVLATVKDVVRKMSVCEQEHARIVTREKGRKDAGD